MSAQTLPLVLPTGSKELLLETDPQTGRTAVRVNGRPVTRPLMATEEEREFVVDGAKLILRRMPNGQFDVDYAPPDFSKGSSEPQWVGPPPKGGVPKKNAAKTTAGIGIGGVVAFILFRALASIAVRGALGSGSVKLQVSDFHCERVGPTDFMATGNVKNISNDPLSLTAQLTIKADQTTAKATMTTEVTPRPLLAGQMGTFAIREHLPSNMDFGNGGDCRLNPFLDSAGNKVGYK